jgi:hypothetical protein
MSAPSLHFPGRPLDVCRGHAVKRWWTRPLVRIPPRSRSHAVVPLAISLLIWALPGDPAPSFVRRRSAAARRSCVAGTRPRSVAFFAAWLGDAPRRVRSIVAQQACRQRHCFRGCRTRSFWSGSPRRSCLRGPCCRPGRRPRTQCAGGARARADRRVGARGGARRDPVRCAVAARGRSASSRVRRARDCRRRTRRRGERDVPAVLEGATSATCECGAARRGGARTRSPTSRARWRAASRASSACCRGGGRGRSCGSMASVGSSGPARCSGLRRGARGGHRVRAISGGSSSCRPRWIAVGPPCAARRRFLQSGYPRGSVRALAARVSHDGGRCHPAPHTSVRSTWRTRTRAHAVPPFGADSGRHSSTTLQGRVVAGPSIAAGLS